MLLISIPTPCHEKWNEMEPRQQGAYCKVCSRTVVDFTGKSDEEIKNYLFQKSGQKACGRFRNDQLSDTDVLLPRLLNQPIPFWKKFLAILLVVFGSFLTSCQTATIGKIRIEETEKTHGKTDYDYVTPEVQPVRQSSPATLVEDSVDYIVGMVVPIDEQPIIKVETTEEKLLDPTPIKKILDENGNVILPAGIPTFPLNP